MRTLTYFLARSHDNGHAQLTPCVTKRCNFKSGHANISTYLSFHPSAVLALARFMGPASSTGGLRSPGCHGRPSRSARGVGPRGAAAPELARMRPSRKGFPARIWKLAGPTQADSHSRGGEIPPWTKGRSPNLLALATLARALARLGRGTPRTGGTPCSHRALGRGEPFAVPDSIGKHLIDSNLRH